MPRGAYVTSLACYPNGAIAGFTYGNGVVHTLTQSTRGLPDRSKDADGATSIHDDSYDYYTVGNVLAISDAVSGNRGDRTMTYDALNRLTQVTGNNAPSLMFGTASYSYDVLDNLTHVQVTAGAQARNQDYVYDAANRLTNVMAGGLSVIGLGYDVQGNLANKNGVTYAFDYGNRMRSGGPETYRYDASGRRTRSINSTGQVIYSLYAQSGQLLFQQDERSAKRRQYIYLGGSLVAESDMPLVGSTATVTYQHTDALGSPVATTNSSKTVLQRSEYEPYGYLLNRPMEDGPGYTGHVTDAATGLVYMQQRYMDPLIGQRFLSVDPVTAYSPGGAFNQYWYAADNPYSMVDPDGRDPGESEEERRRANEQAAQKAYEEWRRQQAELASANKYKPAGSMLELLHNIGHAIKDRSSASATGEVALGSGADAEATKNTYGKADTVGANYIVGIGAHVGAQANYRLFTWGAKSGSTGGRVEVNPSSYLKIKLGLGVSVGFSLNLNDRGGGNLSVNIGGGFGAGVFYKPPVTMGYEKEL